MNCRFDRASSDGRDGCFLCIFHEPTDPYAKNKKLLNRALFPSRPEAGELDQCTALTTSFLALIGLQIHLL